MKKLLDNMFMVLMFMIVSCVQNLFASDLDKNPALIELSKISVFPPADFSVHILPARVAPVCFVISMPRDVASQNLLPLLDLSAMKLLKQVSKDFYYSMHHWQRVLINKQRQACLDVNGITPMDCKSFSQYNVPILPILLSHVIEGKPQDFVRVIPENFARKLNLCRFMPCFIAALGEVGEQSYPQTLESKGNDYDAIPYCIRQLKGLNSLLLPRNKLLAVPTWISEMKELTHLVLSHNLLKSLPSSIGELTNLECLCLNNNKLPFLSPRIARLPKLKTLKIDDNPMLQWLPGSFRAFNEKHGFNFKGEYVDYDWNSLPDGFDPLEYINLEEALKVELANFNLQVKIKRACEHYLKFSSPK
jgi:Leucine rich repeat